MNKADRIIFMGTSFSVNITNMALNIALEQNKPIEIVDPEPKNNSPANAIIHKMKASTYINKVEKAELI